MISRTQSGPLEDVEFLARSEHRARVLEAIADGPRSRDALLTETEASPSTIRRTLRAFEDRRWIRRDGGRYVATDLGAYVAEGVRDLLERLDTERRLRDVWQWLPDDESGFSLEMATAGVVTVADVDSPYRPVNRFASLLQGTDRFRFVGSDLALLEPLRHDLRRRVVDGMRAEIIDPPSVARYVLSNYEEHCSACLESGNLTVRLHDDLPPYGVGIFDDRVAVACPDQETGTIRALIDTDDVDARAWAESTFESFGRESRPLAHDAVAQV